MYGVQEVACLTYRKRNDILETFWNSGLHGEDWPSVAYVIVTCKLDNAKCSYASRNIPNGRHAEATMVTWLWERAEDGSLSSDQSVTMYMNYSPCHRCSRKLGSLAVEQLDDCRVGLEVVVAGLYRIARPSCESCDTHRMPDGYDHDRNVQGLRELEEVGVVVRTFNSAGKQDWNRLATHALQVEGFRYKGSDRKEEDEKLEEDLQTVLMEVTAAWPAYDVIEQQSRRTKKPVTAAWPAYDVIEQQSGRTRKPVTAAWPGYDIIEQQSRRTSQPVTAARPGYDVIEQKSRRTSQPVTAARPGYDVIKQRLRRTSQPVTAARPGYDVIEQQSHRTSQPVTAARPGYDVIKQQSRRTSQSVTAAKPGYDFIEQQSHRTSQPVTSDSNRYSYRLFDITDDTPEHRESSWSECSIL